MLVSVAGSAIIQIPQMARNRIAAEKAILDRAQKQPQHSHGASKQQPPPIVAMQNSARYGKAPRHGQADIDQIGQQKTHGGGQRRGQAIQLPKKNRQGRTAPVPGKALRWIFALWPPFPHLRTVPSSNSYSTIQKVEKPAFPRKNEPIGFPPRLPCVMLKSDPSFPSSLRSRYVPSPEA